MDAIHKSVAVFLAFGSLIVFAFSTPQAAQEQPAGSFTHADGLFQTSSECMACHNSLTTPSGEDVSIGAAWRGSMMANSARDPYWQASVRREIMDHPDAVEEIENECS